MVNRKKLGWALMLTGLLSGCASAPAQFYALNNAQNKVTKLQTVSPVYIEMLPVNVPVSLARPQIVLRDGLRLDIREQQRWGAPFNEEMRSVLASQLSEKLGATDVTYVGVSPDKDTYRVSVDVQQFDVIKGDAIKGHVAWTVNRLNHGQPQTCQLNLNVPIGLMMNDMVRGIQQATLMISNQIGEGIAMQQKEGKINCTQLQ